jgi:DNA topoisomerase-1
MRWLRSWRRREVVGASVEKKERRRNPSAPYTTSKLQQDASSRLGFNVRRTMGVAQRLYEGVEIGKEGTVGLITYMRTDSTRVSRMRSWRRASISAKLGKVSAGEGERVQGQEAGRRRMRMRRFGRPCGFTPESIRRYLSDEQFRLYRMIWQRFVSSQMTQAVFDQTTVDIEAKADRTV